MLQVFKGGKRYLRLPLYTALTKPNIDFYWCPSVFTESDSAVKTPPVLPALIT